MISIFKFIVKFYLVCALIEVTFNVGLLFLQEHEKNSQPAVTHSKLIRHHG